MRSPDFYRGALFWGPSLKSVLLILALQVWGLGLRGPGPNVISLIRFNATRISCKIAC